MRKKIIVILISVIVFVALICLTFSYLTRLPSGCDRMRFRMGCVKIQEETKFDWSGDISSVIYLKDSTDESISNNKNYLKYILFLLKNISKTETEDAIRDVQLIEFSFGSETDNFETYYLAYDFYQKKIYTLENDKWYEIKENERLNEEIILLIDNSNVYPFYLKWRGQSTYTAEEFVESDWDNATFRYDLYWRPSVNSEYLVEYDYHADGFRNSNTYDIKDKEQAILRAAEELQYTNPKGFVFYDETCGYWMVELYEDQGVDMTPSNEAGDFLHKNVYTVIIDKQGRTLETYRGVTRYSAFWQNS